MLLIEIFKSNKLVRKQMDKMRKYISNFHLLKNKSNHYCNKYKHLLKVLNREQLEKNKESLKWHSSKNKILKAFLKMKKKH